MSDFELGGAIDIHDPRHGFLAFRPQLPEDTLGTMHHQFGDSHSHGGNTETEFGYRTDVEHTPGSLMMRMQRMARAVEELGHRVVIAETVAEIDVFGAMSTSVHEAIAARRQTEELQLAS